ncbi:hypothetical protein ACIXK0_03260 [Bacteroides fragilis]
MKAKTLSEVKGGYLWGILSGMTWGLDTVLIGIIMSAVPFTTSMTLIATGTFVCSFFHDGFAAMWMTLLLVVKKKIYYLIPKLKTRDGFFLYIGRSSWWSYRNEFLYACHKKRRSGLYGYYNQLLSGIGCCSCFCFF